MAVLRSRRQKILATVAAALLLACVYVFGCEPRYSGRLVAAGSPPGPLIFAHRGFGDLGPDNSLYAVERALAAGMDGVDVDGQLSRDSELVIFHDLSVDRLTSGTGRVRELTRVQLLALDLGPKFDPRITGATVRTFEDFVVATQGRGILMVELKVPGLGATGIEARAVEIIRRHHAHANVVLSSFNPIVLRRLKRLDPNVRTAFIFMDTNWNPELLAEIRPEDRVDLPWMVRQEWIRRGLRKLIRPDLLSINHEVDPAVTRRLIARGWPVFIWTPNDDAAIRRALAARPYGVISDQPVRARQLRDLLDVGFTRTGLDAR
jgi:glycerophosphoryl diester phosphodiesterase